MKIIPQISVFDYGVIEILGDLERCKLLIDNVPDEKIVKKLTEKRGKGRNKTNNRYKKSMEGRNNKTI